MFKFDDQTRIVFFNKPINLHKGFDALAHIATFELGIEFLPNLFVLFCNKRKTHIKILHYNGKNFMILSTRFESALKFKYQESVIFDARSFDKFINTTWSKRYLGRYKNR